MGERLVYHVWKIVERVTPTPSPNEARAENDDAVVVAAARAGEAAEGRVASCGYVRESA
jgi:hypothetical protein